MSKGVRSLVTKVVQALDDPLQGEAWRLSISSREALECLHVLLPGRLNSSLLFNKKEISFISSFDLIVLFKYGCGLHRNHGFTTMSMRYGGKH